MNEIFYQNTVVNFIRWFWKSISHIILKKTEIFSLKVVVGKAIFTTSILTVKSCLKEEAINVREESFVNPLDFFPRRTTYSIRKAGCMYIHILTIYIHQKVFSRKFLYHIFVYINVCTYLDYAFTYYLRSFILYYFLNFQMEFSFVATQKLFLKNPNIF